MYKKQMTAQKFLCMAAIIVSAIFFLYTLGIMTDLYDSLYSTMRNPNDPTQTTVPGSIIYYAMQGFNRALLMLSIGQILLAALLFLTNTTAGGGITSATMSPPPCSRCSRSTTPYTPTPTSRRPDGSSSRWISPP